MRKCLHTFLLMMLCCYAAYAQQIQVSGVVISADDNEPVIGASVTAKGASSIGTITDFDGRYEFRVPAETKKLVVSYIGMNTVEIDAKLNVKTILESSSEQLE